MVPCGPASHMHQTPETMERPLGLLLPDPCLLFAPVSWAAANLGLRPGWCHFEHDSLFLACLE